MTDIDIYTQSPKDAPLTNSQPIVTVSEHIPWNGEAVTRMMMGLNEKGSSHIGQRPASEVPPLTDIYPQSEPDSHALLAEQHPLAERVRELEENSQHWFEKAEYFSAQAEKYLELSEYQKENLDSLHSENQGLRAENIELQHKLEACIKTIAVISERLILEDI